ncbi:MAG: LacI family DNA-binding transcriptional regulator [Clostridia bacterium]|nr:LacI family DNA-binding transcriptional regulator [Clostridia bacterium]
MTSIKDIAQHCGVAVSTVSRVLNDHPDVSPETREKVMAAAEALHYIPNNSARNLVRAGSDSIVALVRGMSNPFFQRLTRVIEREIMGYRGLTLELHHIDTHEDELHAARLLINERKPRGLLFLGGRFNYAPADIALISVPFVMCSYTNSFGSLHPDSYSSVSIDDRAAARRAVDELIRLGHRRIAILADSTDDRSVSELRFQGYRDALEAHGLPFDEGLVACARSFSDMARIYGATGRLIESGAAFTALFAIADLMALAAIKALHDHGRRVPEDCSVIAIDGLDVTAYTLPVLTTLRQPVEEIGRACAKTLLERVFSEGGNRQILAVPALRAGGSVAPLA